MLWWCRRRKKDKNKKFKYKKLQEQALYNARFWSKHLNDLRINC